MHHRSLNLDFKGERTNVYTTTSEMAMNDGTTLTCGWLRAQPRLIPPGMNVEYHYDDNGGIYRVKKGRILGIAYVSALTPSQMGTVPWMYFNASLSAILEAENSDEPKK